MDALFLVGIGGFLGANARYWMTVWMDSVLVPRADVFPFGTLAVNLLGSFGLAHGLGRGPDWRRRCACWSGLASSARSRPFRPLPAKA